MAKTKASADFERQVERLHLLLERDGAVVTWDDHIPDPDKPDQPRQIDITIRRAESLTLVECRFHKQRQDVKWIEELIGRRASLGADAVIGVSASGFTSTARAKAERFGVFLRDFSTLSSKEVEEWGKRRTMTAHFCEFMNSTLTLVMPRPAASPSPALTTTAGRPLEAINWRALLNKVITHLSDIDWTGQPSTLSVEFKGGLLVDGVSPSEITLKTKVRRLSETVEVTSVRHYIDSVASVHQADVGNYSLGNTELIEDEDRVALTIDLGSMRVPDHCCFYRLDFDAGRRVAATLATIGVDAAISFNVDFDVQLVFPSADSLRQAR